MTVCMLKEAYFDREDVIIKPGAPLPALPDYPTTQQSDDDASSDGQGDTGATENDITEVDQLVPVVAEEAVAVSSEDDAPVPGGGIEPPAGLSSHAAKAAAAARKDFPTAARGAAVRGSVPVKRKRPGIEITEHQQVLADVKLMNADAIALAATLTSKTMFEGAIELAKASLDMEALPFFEKIAESVCSGKDMFQGLVMRIVHKDERGVQMWQIQNKEKKTLVFDNTDKAMEKCRIGGTSASLACHSWSDE